MKIILFIIHFIIETLIIVPMNCFTFSVVMAIYNTGRYLDESIGSLINQTIGFEEIQLILVNNGSYDNSEEICLKYRIIYPNNIIYIKINNKGVSEARNIGMSQAKGEYINFLDPDDLWDSYAFEHALSFLKNHKDINLVSGRMKFFEARNDYHLLDYKFYKTRIVNLTEEYNCIQSSSSSSFFRSSYIFGKKFKKGLPTGEDTRFINEILLINPIMGLIREAIYFCRKRNDYTSRTQTQKNDKKFYFSIIINVNKYLIDLSKSLYKEVLPFIKFYIAYEILFRIESPSYKYLNVSNYLKYCHLIDELLKEIDDKYILEQKCISNKLIMVALSKKYNRDLRYDIVLNKGLFKYSNFTFINLKEVKNIIIWKIISIKNGILHLEGEDNLWLPREKYFYFCEIGNRTFYPKLENYKIHDFNSLYGIVEKGKLLVFDIPLENKEEQTVNVYISYMNIHHEIFTTQGYFTHIPKIKEGYYISENYIIKMNKRRLMIFQYKEELENTFEQQYCSKLSELGKNNIINLRIENKQYRRRLKNGLKKKELWIINDKKNQAGDNGEYFFRYLYKIKQKEVDVFFAIQKNCSDFQRMKKLGNILDIYSNEYLRMFLRSDKLISSVINLWVDNPFGEDHKYIKDLFKFNFIYIQNGITKDDLSIILNRFSRNIDLIVTSTEKEYNYILTTDYGYNIKNIILTGLPRFDYLENFNKELKFKNNKLIIVLPTWRMYITGKKESLIYENIHSDSFKYTKFFKFYNNLINDEKLLKIMNTYNYTGVFCLHLKFSAQWVDFIKNKHFIIKENCNYQNLIKEGSLLITDYSSVFFDFGYLKKPVIYTHFDYEEYRANHYSEGYFNYKRDGFGPICNDINTTVNNIIKLIKNNCIINKKYLERINSFFTFKDENNSDRLYKEILRRTIKKSYNNKIISSFNIIIIFFIFLFLKPFLKIFLL